MAKIEKLEQKIRNNPKGVSPKDFERLILHYGSIKEHKSHPIAVIGDELVTYARDRKTIRPKYVGWILKAIDKVKKINKEK